MGKDSHVIDAAEFEEEISDSFICCICLDLLYKPIVLPCGHISCFWCVHKSMYDQLVSSCPICRHPYNHFPTICQMLYILLLKMYPAAYKRREEQILAEEKKMGYFSPQFNYKACDIDQQHDHQRDAVYALDGCFIRNAGHGASAKQVENASMIQDTDMPIPKYVCNENCSMMKPVSVEEKDLPENKANGNCKQISIADVQCAACKLLLFHPVVLNCGHVYCETCIVGQVDEGLTCQVCQSLHPADFPRVCLEFDHFLEQHFPKEYALRRDTVHFKFEHPTTCSPKASEKGSVSSLISRKDLTWWADADLKVHGAGCDSCGVCPIVGDRYKCMDCVEKIGFDLCGDCYNTRSKRPGRFNQQHTPEHKFKLVDTNTISLRLVSGQLEDVSTFPNHDGASEISGNESSFLTLDSDVHEIVRNSLATTVSQTESVEDENEAQSTS